jgi:transcriptional regulator with XRE-family HTH domain
MLKMTPAQSRAARALLDWSQPRLAEAAALGLSTVVDFERSRRSLPEKTLAAIRAALEAAGVEFIAENGGGPGVRLRKQLGELKGTEQ